MGPRLPHALFPVPFPSSFLFFFSLFFCRPRALAAAADQQAETELGSSVLRGKQDRGSETCCWQAAVLMGVWVGGCHPRFPRWWSPRSRPALAPVARRGVVSPRPNQRRGGTVVVFFFLWGGRWSPAREQLMVFVGRTAGRDLEEGGINSEREGGAGCPKRRWGSHHSPLDARKRKWNFPSTLGILIFFPFFPLFISKWL